MRKIIFQPAIAAILTRKSFLQRLNLMTEGSSIVKGILKENMRAFNLLSNTLQISRNFEEEL